jgi:RNA polymerase sigma factor (sigma-70 family)
MPKTPSRRAVCACSNRNAAVARSSSRSSIWAASSAISRSISGGGAREARLLRLVAEGGEELGDRRSPEDIVVEREALLCLAAALDALPARTRAAFELHRLAGLDQASIARRLEISQSLAHRLIKDALTHCREALERADRGLR